MALSPLTSKVYSISASGEELARHGNAFFPIAFYHDNLEEMRVTWHWHEEMEAIYIAHGDAVIKAGQKKYDLHEGQAIFINSNVPHAGREKDSTGCRFHSMVFHPRLVGGGLDSIYWESYLKPLIKNGSGSFALDGRESWHAKGQMAIETAWQEGAADEPGFEFRVRSALSELIFLLVSHMPEVQKESSLKDLRDMERIRQMLQFISDHFADPLTMQDIADSASISISECLRCFHNTIEIPPIQFLKQYRIRKAAEMLRTSERKISDIAETCGFSDTSYFNRVFRAEKGITPGDFRRLHFYSSSV